MKEVAAGSERGTSLAEVMVVVALLALVALPILATLQSATRAEDRIGASIDDTAALRRVEQLWLSDVRTGTVTMSSPTPLNGDHAMRLATADGGLLVEWRRTEAGLVRRELDPGGMVLAEVVLVTADGLDPDPARATFSSTSARGAALDPSATALLDACAAALTVTLWEPDRADPSFSLTAAPRVRWIEEACP